MIVFKKRGQKVINQIKSLFFIKILFFSLASSLLAAPCTENEAPDGGHLRYWLHTLYEGSWEETDKILCWLPKDNPEVNNALLTRLNQETQYFKSITEEERDGRFEYYMGLTHQITLLEDEKVVAPLSETLGLISGKRVPDILAKFSTQALPLLLKKYPTTKDADSKSGVLFALERIMLKQQSLPPEERNNIRAVLLEGLQDENPFVRQDAINALIVLNDRSVEPYLDEVAKTDVFKLPPSPDSYSGLPVYPVRALAKKALRSLQTTRQAEN